MIGLCTFCSNSSAMETVIFFGALFLSGVLAACERNPKLNVTAPAKELRAVTGSCLQIPCTFSPAPGRAIDQSQAIHGVWIERDPRIEYRKNIIFNSSASTSKYPVRIIGNMTQNNCTTMFSNLTTRHTNKYYFRVENGAFKATASCHALQVTVKDSWSPTIEISGDQTESGVVTVTCTADTPCPHTPPVLAWDLPRGVPENILQQNSDGTFTTKITQTMTLTEAHDGRRIKCTAAYRLGGGVREDANTITLNVTYGPKDTRAAASPSGSLSAGRSVMLSCSSRARPPVRRFTWFRRSSQGAANVSRGQTYSFNLSADAHGEYYCEADNNIRKQTSGVIHVSPGGVKAARSSSQSVAIAGGIVGIFLVLIVIFIIWKLKPKTSQRSQSPTTPVTAAQVHYGHIDFPQGSQGRGGRGKDQEAVYSALKASST